MVGDPKKKTLIIYHADCPDGFGASYSAWKHFGNKAIYMGVFHNTKPPEEVEDRDVFTLDYCYDRENMEEIKSKALSLTVIDHHVSHKELLPLADKHVFDIDHSGAVLAWKYFNPKIKVPRLLKNIEDIDIWKFKLPYTRELSAITNFYKFDYKVWDKMVKEIETKSGLKKYVAQGSIMIKKIDKMVQDQMDDAEEVSFEGHRCLAVNSPVNVSLLGNALVKRKPPFAIIWSRRRNKIIVSLRSDGTFDVSKLAQKYGGGGHKASAAFSFEVDNFFDKLNDIFQDKIKK